MASHHIVVQGEHLSQIAEKYGFKDYRTIWDHGQNAALKAKRKNPNVLHPGDDVFVPDREPKEESRPTDQRHRFQVKVPNLKLRIVVEDQYERPIGNAPCELTIDGQIFKHTTDGKGKIEQDIPAAAGQGRLVLTTPETALDKLVVAIRIGHLDPVEEVTGQQARLDEPRLLPRARRRQGQPALPSRRRGVPVRPRARRGRVCGPLTQAKLKSVHGC